MILYLVRHGDAKREEEDHSRPLSESGIQAANKLGAHLSGLNIKVDQIFHSDKLRARQTAEILTEHLKPSRTTSETHGLAPLDDPKIWAVRLKDRTDALILAGHLPHLCNLASYLLCGNTEKNFISLKPAGMLCLQRTDDGMWFLRWMMSPEIL
ncbi:MAG: phosphohistidine phosphatase SixA [Candidatus Brocadiaceae bacterium]|nr:phosphohistidine phosphatase SixA [Candidatus Brocadiaceae bacterium]